MLTPNVVPDFTALKVAVVGDLIADHYLYACPTRLSREAPVMVMRYLGEEIGTGGAANVARNVWSLGPGTMLLGACGRDANGREILRMLESEQIDVSGVRSVPEWTTPTKTRVLGAEPGRTMHQVLRIDREPGAPIAAEVRRGVAAAVRSLAGRIDALLVSDYGYGLVGEELAAAALEVRQAGGIVVLDPRRTYEPFRGVTAVTPNLAELATATFRPIEAMDDQAQVLKAANEFLDRYEPELLLVTMGNRGMALFHRDERRGITIRAAGSESVIDVSGAGDTAASTFTLGLAAGLEGPRAMRLANAAAGVVVMEHGATVCTLSTLRSALPNAPQPTLSTALVGG
jgi:rfaE bifunctional protein kinase chain/domain